MTSTVVIQFNSQSISFCHSETILHFLSSSGQEGCDSNSNPFLEPLLEKISSSIPQVWKTKPSTFFFFFFLILFLPTLWSNTVSSAVTSSSSGLFLLMRCWSLCGWSSLLFVQPLWPPLPMLIVVLALFVWNHCYCCWKHKNASLPAWQRSQMGFFYNTITKTFK